MSITTDIIVPITTTGAVNVPLFSADDLFVVNSAPTNRGRQVTYGHVSAARATPLTITTRFSANGGDTMSLSCRVAAKAESDDGTTVSYGNMEAVVSVNGISAGFDDPAGVLYLLGLAYRAYFLTVTTSEPDVDRLNKVARGGVEF